MMSPNSSHDVLKRERDRMESDRSRWAGVDVDAGSSSGIAFWGSWRPASMTFWRVRGSAALLQDYRDNGGTAGEDALASPLVACGMYLVMYSSHFISSSLSTDCPGILR